MASATTEVVSFYDCSSNSSSYLSESKGFCITLRNHQPLHLTRRNYRVPFD